MHVFGKIRTPIFQLGGTITQDGKPLKEFLSIVEVLREFRNILLGRGIIIHTDPKHKKLWFTDGD